MQSQPQITPEQIRAAGKIAAENLGIAPKADNPFYHRANREQVERSSSPPQLTLLHLGYRDAEHLALAVAEEIKAHQLESSQTAKAAREAAAAACFQAEKLEGQWAATERRQRELASLLQAGLQRLDLLKSEFEGLKQSIGDHEFNAIASLVNPNNYGDNATWNFSQRLCCIREILKAYPEAISQVSARLEQTRAELCSIK